jgi:LacI family transcriptional regulator
MTATIQTVARKARVSHMTVTRVLRDDKSVRPATRSRVLAAMARLGYVPSPIKRGIRNKDPLRWNGGLCFALVFGPYTHVSDGFFSAVARGAEEAAAGNGLCLVQVHWQTTAAESWPRLQPVFAMDGMCGAVLVGQFTVPDVQKVIGHVKNVVVVDAPAPAGLPVGSVESENLPGCLLALDHLRQRGAKNILVLTGPADHYFSAAMALAADQFRPKMDSVDIVATDYSSAGAEATVKNLWVRGRRYDGIFGNDEIAIGVLRALADRNVRVPRDVRVVGFDDIPYAAFAFPRLSTIGIDKRQLGYESVKTLVEMIRKESPACPIKKMIRANLIMREST